MVVGLWDILELYRNVIDHHLSFNWICFFSNIHMQNKPRYFSSNSEDLDFAHSPIHVTLNFSLLLLGFPYTVGIQSILRILWALRKVLFLDVFLSYGCQETWIKCPLGRYYDELTSVSGSGSTLASDCFSGFCISKDQTLAFLLWDDQRTSLNPDPETAAASLRLAGSKEKIIHYSSMKPHHELAFLHCLVNLERKGDGNTVSQEFPHMCFTAGAVPFLHDTPLL